MSLAEGYFPIDNKVPGGRICFICHSFWPEDEVLCPGCLKFFTVGNEPRQKLRPAGSEAEPHAGSQREVRESPHGR